MDVGLLGIFQKAGAPMPSQMEFLISKILTHVILGITADLHIAAQTAGK